MRNQPSISRQRRRMLLGVTAGAAAVPAALMLVPTGPAGATPGSGASGTIVAQGTTGDRLHVEANGDTRLVYQRVTLQPGGYTGWHYHPGPLLVVVESGTLTHYDDTCAAQTYSAGQAFEELPGQEHVHMGQNLGSDPVVLDVTYVVPANGPLRVEAPAPSCVSG